MHGWIGCLSALALVAMLGAAAADGTASLSTLTVRIENVTTRGGALHVGVYDADSYAVDSAPVLSRTLKPVPGTMTVTFVGVPPGVYGVKVVQDVNRNRANDRHLLGASAEPVGYSNVAGRADRPAFRAIQFTVTQGDNKAIVRMHD